LDPSVAQPPLPLHEFLPLQPLSLELQPPLPLQELRPLQACFSTLSAAGCPARGVMAELAELTPAPDVFVFTTVAARATVPPSKPVNAAVSTRELFEIFISYSPFSVSDFVNSTNS
jgi:hypothetical protein